MPLLNNQNKLLAFEYVLKNLLFWHREINPDVQSNDLSILKSIKLLFFVSAVNSRNGESNYLLNNVFTDFVAMPYGHVESVIYDAIRQRQGKLDYFEVDNKNTRPIQGKNISDLDNVLDQLVKKEINLAISNLKKINPYLITLSAFELVDLSHSYYSWKKSFSEAQAKGMSSLSIPSEDIIREDKLFNLHIF